MERGQAYQTAKDRVKIGILTELGLDFKGVVHVGVNDGYELAWYRMMGLRTLGFEPLKSAYDKAAYRCEGDPEVFLCNWGISTVTGTFTLHETVSNRGWDDSGGSSFLAEKISSEHTTVRGVDCQVFTVADTLRFFPNINPDDYDCLVIDVQGMELDVLRSFEAAGILQNFRGLNVECSREPCYEGESPAQEVVDWLVERGFTQETPIEDHNDILFSKR